MPQQGDDQDKGSQSATAKNARKVATQTKNEDAVREQQVRSNNNAFIQSLSGKTGSPQERNTYANAPTQFTPTNTGAFYPTVTPDNIATKYGNMFGGGLSGLASRAIGTNNPIGQALDAYNNLNPADKFLNQAYYGMNDPSMREYKRLEASDPNWANMSEKERVNAAREPYMAANNLNANPATRPKNMNADIWAGLTQGQRNFMGDTATGSGGNDGSNLSYSNNGNNMVTQFPNVAGAFQSGNNGQYFDGGYTGSAVDQLSQARAPRGMAIDSIYGSTRFNPLTGQMDTTTAPEYEQFQQGLLGQLQGSQEAYQSFDPQDAASEYLRGVNAIREPLRQGQEQTALSRLVQSGKLGSTAGTQALAQLASEQENQRFQEGVQATQYGADMQDRMLRNQAGMFGLTSQVANQQFLPQQQAMAAVPMLQEIYGFAQEPQFQESLAQQGIAAQQSANSTQNWWDLGTGLLGTQSGQNAIAEGWDWLTGLG